MRGVIGGVTEFGNTKMGGHKITLLLYGGHEIEIVKLLAIKENVPFLMGAVRPSVPKTSTFCSST